MIYKVEIVKVKDQNQRFAEQWVVFLKDTNLLVAQGFKDYVSVRDWIHDYNNSHVRSRLEVVGNEP